MAIAYRRIYILAGPNGAGKTTFAREFLVSEGECPVFINADLIAEGVSPFAPERAAVRAGRIMLDLMEESVRRGESFAFETTLASRGYARSIAQWHTAGYKVVLHFLSLPSADFAVARVAQRVRQGGHSIPETTIRRRFAAGRHNFDHLYKDLVDSWTLYDGAGDQPIILGHGGNS
ncbi:MAG: zeta toxin family protein [Polyangiaceae bacterium]|nr:zeta toxin family protein [Polyangiaceae bacterium]